MCLLVLIVTLRSSSKNIHGEDDSTQSSAKDYFDGPPILASQVVQVTGECDTREQIREEDIYSTCEDQLIENGPVRNISLG